MPRWAAQGHPDPELKQLQVLKDAFRPGLRIPYGSFGVLVNGTGHSFGLVLPTSDLLREVEHQGRVRFLRLLARTFDMLGCHTGGRLPAARRSCQKQNRQFTELSVILAHIYIYPQGIFIHIILYIKREREINDREREREKRKDNACVGTSVSFRI